MRAETGTACGSPLQLTPCVLLSLGWNAVGVTTGLPIGCTGGRHRSVAMSELLFATLRDTGYAVTLEHRHFDLG